MRNILFALIFISKAHASLSDYQLEDIYYKIHGYYGKYHISQKVLSAEYLVSTMGDFAKDLDPNGILLSEEKINAFQEDLRKEGVYGEYPTIQAIFQSIREEADKTLLWLREQDLEEIYEKHKGKDYHKLNSANNESELIERKEAYFALRYAHYRARGLNDVEEIVYREWERRVQDLKSYKSSLVLSDFLRSLAKSLDPFSDFERGIAIYPEDHFFSGIGIVFDMVDEGMKITNILPKSPAYNSRVMRGGDIILKVQFYEGGSWHLARHFKDYEISHLLQGEGGSRIGFHLKKESGKVIGFYLNRGRGAAISEPFEEVDSKIKAYYIKDTNTDKYIPVIRIPKFYKTNAASDFKEALESIKKEGDVRKLSKSIVLDLRGNPGGSLEQAQKMIYLLVGELPVAYKRERFGDNIKLEVLNSIPIDNENDYSDKPLVVIVDSDCASACEFLTSYLKKSSRALIIGAKSTFGKGIGQYQFEQEYVNDYVAETFGTAHISVLEYYDIEGKRVQGRGVSSDVIFPDKKDLIQDKGMSSLENYYIGEEVSVETKNVIDFSLVNGYLIKGLQEKATRFLSNNNDFQSFMDLEQELYLAYTKEPSVIDISELKRAFEAREALLSKRQEVFKNLLNKSSRFLGDKVEKDPELQNYLQTVMEYEKRLPAN